MSGRLLRAIAERAIAVGQIELILREDYPPGSAVRFKHGDFERQGTVLTVASGDKLIVELPGTRSRKVIDAALIVT